MTERFEALKKKAEQDKKDAEVKFKDARDDYKQEQARSRQAERRQQEKQTFKERQMEEREGAQDITDVFPKKKEPEFRMPGAGGKPDYRITKDRAFPAAASVSAEKAFELAASPDFHLKKAQEDYDAYLNSEEYRQKKQPRDVREMNAQFLNDQGLYGEEQKDTFDEKAQELRAKRDYWNNQKDQEDIRRITERNVGAYEAMPEEDRYAMDVLTGEHGSDGTSVVVTPYGSDDQLTELQAVELENGLRRKYGAQRIKEIAESLQWERSRQMAETTQAEAERLAEEHPVVGSAFALGANIFGGVLETIGYGVEALTRTGQYPTLNPYSEGGDLRRYGQGIVSGVASEIEGEDPNALRKLGSFAYQGGMEAMRSSGSAILMGPAGSAALSAATSLGSGISEASAQGASPGRAALNAGVSAAIEYATEKADMDRLFDILGSGNPATIKGWLKNTAKQMGAEVAEEEVSLFAGELAESAILGDKAGRKQKIDERIANGMSYEEAVSDVNRELLNEALNTAAVTSISAGMSATGATLGSKLKNRTQGGGDGVSVQDTAANIPEAPEAAVSGQMDITDVFGMEAPQAAMEAPAAVQEAPRASREDGSAPLAQAAPGAPGTARSGKYQRETEAAIQEFLETGRLSQEAADKVASGWGIEDLPGLPGQYSIKNKRKRLEAVQAGIAKLAEGYSPRQAKGTAMDITDVFQGGAKNSANQAPEANMDITDVFGNGQTGAETGFDTDDFLNRMGQELAERAGPVEYPKLPEDVQRFIDMTVPPTARNAAPGKNDVQGTTSGVENNPQSMYNNIQERSQPMTGQSGNENNGGNVYAAAENEFRGLQAEVRGMSGEESGAYHRGRQRIDGALQGRLEGVLRGWINARTDGSGNGNGLLTVSDKKTGSQFNLHQNVSGDVFHDVFEIARSYLRNGELVDLHTAVTTDEGIGYNDCKNYLSDDGMSGFSITPDGDLISVFNLGKKHGFLRAVSNIVTDNAKTLDCYNSPEQPLPEFYRKAFGFKIAAVMDYNMEFDHDNIAANHNMPQVAFMVNTDADVETKHFAKDQYEEAVAYRDSFAESGNGRSTSKVPADVPGGQRPVTDQNPNVKGVGGADVNGEFGGEGQKMSRLYENTFRNATDENIRDMGGDVQKNRPDIAMYTPQTEKGQNAEADARIEAAGANQEYKSLMEKEAWTAADNKAAYKVMDALRKSGDSEAFYELSKKQREINTAAGQVVQSNAEYTRNTPMGAAESACAYLDELGEKGIDKRFWKKEGFENWSKSVRETVVDVSNKIDQVKDGDTASMRAIVEELARFRHTTAWLGYTNKLTWGARRALNSMDYQTMREVAIKQMSMIPGDFRKRSKAEVANTIRIQKMLASFKTINRNLQGNAIQGLMDSLSDSAGGQLADVILSKFTGVRTTGTDITRGKEASKAARQAWEFATLCLELDIPTESASAYDFGAKSRTGGGSTNTFSMQGGPVERFMAGFTQYMKYALDATDSVFSEGSKGSTIASLEKLGAKSGLSGEEIEMIGDYNGERRTYKEERKLGKAAKGIKNAANEIQVGGVGLGDMVMPFVGVPSNVTQTAIDYSGVGMIEGITEMVQVAKDAKSMGTMTQEQRNKIILRQRKAAADFGRGMTGAGLLALGIVASKFGCVKYTTAKDKDEENAQLNRHMEGFQINWSAIGRVFQGQSGDWQEGDIVSGLDSQSQFASLFSMADIWASDEGSWIQKSQDSAMAMYNNILEMPAMQDMKDLTEMIESLGDAMDGDSDDRATAMGTMLGDMASGAYPAFVRNAAQAMDPVIRDTSDSDPMQAAVNRVKAAIPGLSKTLPEKIDPLTGQPQMRDDSAGEAIWNRVFAPDAWHRIKENETAEYLDKLAEETGKTDFYPKGNAPASFRYGEEKITIEGKEDTEAYQQVYADNVSKSYGEMIKDPEFQALSPEEQMEKLKEAEHTATKQAQAAIVGYKEMGEASRQEMLRLHKESGDDSVLYVPPDRNVTYTDKQGNEVKREMTDEEYQTYSDKERQVYDKVMSGFTRLNPDGEVSYAERGVRYDKLSQKEQLEAARYARQYASEMAKRAALGDRYVEPGSWKDINPQAAAKDIVEKVQADTVSRAAAAVFEGSKKGFDIKDEAKALGEEYERFKQLPKDTQKEILRDADGANKKYLMARNDGVDNGTAIKVIKGVGTLGDDVGPNYKTYKKIGELAGSDDKAAMALMKAYMPDYNPNAAKKDYSEPKLDAIVEMGYKPRDYERLHDAYENVEGGDGKKGRSIEALMKAGNCDKETATELYLMFYSFPKSEHGKKFLGK